MVALSLVPLVPSLVFLPLAHGTSSEVDWMGIVTRDMLVIRDSMRHRLVIWDSMRHRLLIWDSMRHGLVIWDGYMG